MIEQNIWAYTITGWFLGSTPFKIACGS